MVFVNVSAGHPFHSRSVLCRRDVMTQAKHESSSSSSAVSGSEEPPAKKLRIDNEQQKTVKKVCVLVLALCHYGNVS